VVSEQNNPTPAGPDEPGGAEVANVPPAKPSRMKKFLPVIIATLAIFAIDIVALILIPGSHQAFPDIKSRVESPAPEIIWRLSADSMISVTNTMFTAWIVTAFVIGLLLFLAAGMKLLPGRRQNILEYIVEALTNFGMSMGGAAAKPYMPFFICLFLFIMFSNYSGLFPLVGQIPWLRAPTSDLNVTFGIAMVSFFTFHSQGFRKLGVRGYLGKFFPIGLIFKSPVEGLIGMFTGILEFVLEFVKPLTLAMRLFGNIYGGEIVLTVMTSLLIAVLPVPFLVLEFFVGFIQALVFATLTLMFTLIAIEVHTSEHGEEHEGEPAHEPVIDEKRPAAKPLDTLGA
jgi:F-type H+-transporting ATPase subunit a